MGINMAVVREAGQRCVGQSKMFDVKVLTNGRTTGHPVGRTISGPVLSNEFSRAHIVSLETDHNSRTGSGVGAITGPGA
jgi:hypothetical protein